MPKPISVPPVAVPLVGQPFELLNWWISINITCRRCDKGTLVTLLGPFVGMCNSCQTQYQFVGLAVGGRPVELTNIGLSIITAAAPLAAEATRPTEVN